MRAKLDEDGAEVNILAALNNLASDTRPFVGEPRACDLYFVHGIIHQTITRALSLLRNIRAWEDALKHLVEISNGTTVSLQNSQSGPLTPADFIKILLPFADNPELNPSLISEFKQLIKENKSRGWLYETLAQQDMLLALALNAGGQEEEAQKLWESVAVQLCGYGFRKDATIFELLESAPILRKSSIRHALNALAATQPLVNAAVAHTDGKGTQYAPIHWVGAIAKVDIVAASFIMVRSLIKDGGQIDWRYEESIIKVIDNARDIANPFLIFFLESTLTNGDGIKDVAQRLNTIEHILAISVSEGEQSLRILAAQVHGDAKQFNTTAYEQLQTFARSHGLFLPHAEDPIDPEERQEDTAYVPKSDPYLLFKDSPTFPANAGLLEAMRTIRSSWRTFDKNNKNQSRIVNAIGFRLLELLQSNRGEDALRLLRCFARENAFYHEAEPLKDTRRRA